MRSCIPNSLRLHRKGTGLRQADVAEILGLGKRGADRILRWEKGYVLPNFTNLLKLSILYSVAPEELYGDLVKTFRKELAKKLPRQKPSKK